MQVRDIMSKNVASVDPNTPIVEVAKIMKNMNIGSVPVCRDGKVLGIVTDRDIVLRNIAMGKDINQVKAQDVMTMGLSTTSPDTDIDDAARIMSEKQIRRLPVVENEKIIGMVALGDLAVRNRYEDNAGEALSDISKPTHTLY